MNVTVRPALPPAMTLNEFLDWEGHTDGHWEYDGARPIPMTGGSPNHGLIIALLSHALLKRLAGTDWKVLVDCGLATVDGKVRYPDVQITGTKLPASARLVPGTVLAFEVISRGTEQVDRVDKVREYAAVSSIRRYVIVTQTAPVLTVLHRADDAAAWSHLPLAAGDMLDLPELGIAVPVDEIYAGLTFPEDDAPDAA